MNLDKKCYTQPISSAIASTSPHPSPTASAISVASIVASVKVGASMSTSESARTGANATSGIGTLYLYKALGWVPSGSASASHIDADAQKCEECPLTQPICYMAY